MIRDRLSWMRFFGSDPGGPLPDENAIRHSRNRLSESGPLKTQGKVSRIHRRKPGDKPRPDFATRELELNPHDSKLCLRASERNSVYRLPVAIPPEAINARGGRLHLRPADLPRTTMLRRIGASIRHTRLTENNRICGQLRATAAGFQAQACRAVLFAQLVDDPSSLPDEFPTAQAQEAERKRLFAIIGDGEMGELDQRGGAGTRPGGNPQKLRRTAAAGL